MEYKIILKDLPKVSLNQWYAGSHWSKRNQIKNNYKFLVKNQIKKVLPKTKKYNCEYAFYFKSRPLDASNCIAMVKLIEDIIFEDDNYNIVGMIKVSSKKGKTDKVEINISEVI